MKNIITIVILLLTIAGMGSCTNQEGDTEFETLTPKNPSDQKGTTEMDSITVQMNTLNDRKF